VIQLSETLGLPGGLHVHPLSLGDFFGLTPGTECGDFISCDSFTTTTMPFPKVGPILSTAEAIALRLGGVLGILLMQKGDAAPCSVRPGGCYDDVGDGEMCYLTKQTILKNGEYACDYACPESGEEFTLKQVGVCKQDIWIDHL